jgi:nucleoside-diphosphate-sugar epimerase
MQTWLIIGAGYTGSRLAQQLAAEGKTVVATRRPTSASPSGTSPASAAAAPPAAAAPAVAAPAAAAPSSSITWMPLDLDAALPVLPAAEVVVFCAPPGRPPGDREARLIGALRGARWFAYVSSTGVYGPATGQWIDEHHPLAPESDSERARAAAEEQVSRACRAAGLPCSLLRAAGIYGPDRGMVARVRRGEARVVGDGRAHLSRIHVVDLVAAIRAAVARRIEGAINCGDDDPAPYGEVADSVAAALGLPPPPRVDPATLTPTARAMLLGNRRISNRRLRQELGVELRYPSWRTALAEELASSGAQPLYNEGALRY